MVFNSLEFLIFFPIAALLYYLLPYKAGKFLLLLSSIFFYATYSVSLCCFLLFSIVFNYIIGFSLQKIDNANFTKVLLFFGIFAQTASLILFKYPSFLNLSTNSSDIITPLGISFITLTGISYLADVQKKKINAEENLLDLALYLSFFPKIIQGPIENAGDFLPQTKKKHPFDFTDFREGMTSFLFGMFLKTVIADRASVSVGNVFDDLSAHGGAEIIFAVLLFAIQIYADFAGYSLIAIGSAGALGFKLKTNFRQPYLSSSVTDFWRRWHISLNCFLRDYIYIPLGGNRKGSVRKYINVLITFLISGLWHGCQPGYIIWGGINGLFVISESVFHKTSHKKSDRKSEKIKPFGIAKTFVFIVFSWTFFRAETLGNISIIFRQIFNNFQPGIFYSSIKSIFFFSDYLFAGQTAKEYIILAVSAAFLFAVDLLIIKNKTSAEKLVKGNRFIRWIVVYILIFSTIIFGVYGYGYNASSFIYTQF